jgi:hypothetical protein
MVVDLILKPIVPFEDNVTNDVRYCYFCRLLKQYLLLLLINQMASGLFRAIAALGRNMIVANTFGSFALLTLLTLGGFVMSRSEFK